MEHSFPAPPVYLLSHTLRPFKINCAFESHRLFLFQCQNEKHTQNVQWKCHFSVYNDKNVLLLTLFSALGIIFCLLNRFNSPPDLPIGQCISFFPCFLIPFWNKYWRKMQNIFWMALNGYLGDVLKRAPNISWFVIVDDFSSVLSWMRSQYYFL